MKNLLCKFHLHKYKAVEGTVQYVDKYMESATLKCSRCGTETYGTRDI